MANQLYFIKQRFCKTAETLRKKIFQSKSLGIDGILVTVGLCIIALVLCVVMKDSLTTFIQTLVSNMQARAIQILSGNP